MKKVLSAAMATMMVLSLAACGGSKPAETTAAPAPAPAASEARTEAPAETKADAPAETQAAGEKAPEDYSGTVVVYSPHDADPLNAGVNLFMAKYPNVKVEVVAAGTGELCNRIAAESANPIADVLWGGGADSLAAFKEYFAPYVCANDDVIDAAYKDPDGLWIGESPLPKEHIQPSQFFFDACYNPDKTQFLLDAEEKGCRILNGLGMSLYQGAAQIELWTGKKAPVEAMRQELLAILAEQNEAK